VYADGSGHCQTAIPGCYEDEDDDEVISDCTCHESCGACGYYDEPTDFDDCLTCSDPLYEVNPLYDDGSGECVEMSGCYGDDGSSMSDCTCDESCGACGYYEDPTDYDDCLTCSEPRYSVTPVYDDGSGECEMTHGCFEYGVDTLFEGCTCHESCGACGYYYDPQSSF
jgi:hypothetical protein